MSGRKGCSHDCVFTDAKEEYLRFPGVSVHSPFFYRFSGFEIIVALEGTLRLTPDQPAVEEL